MLKLLENTRLFPERGCGILIVATCHIHKRAGFFDDNCLTGLLVLGSIYTSTVRLSEDLFDSISFVQTNLTLVLVLFGRKWVLDTFRQLKESSSVVGNQTTIARLHNHNLLAE